MNVVKRSALRAADNILVHGLDTSAKNIAAAREHIRSLGACGKVSGGRLYVATMDGKVSCYARN